MDIITIPNIRRKKPFVALFNIKIDEKNTVGKGSMSQLDFTNMTTCI